MAMAVKVENAYSKAHILEMYLNAIYYGHGQWGVAQASHAYFGKPPQTLDWAEASMLAGLPQALSATTQSCTSRSPGSASVSC